MNKDYCEILLEAIDTMLQGSQVNEQIEEADISNLTEVQVTPVPVEPFGVIVPKIKYTINSQNISVETGKKNSYGSLTLKEPTHFERLGVSGYFTLTPTPGFNESIAGNFGVELKIITNSKTVYLRFDSENDMMCANLNYITNLFEKTIYDINKLGRIKQIFVSIYNNTNSTLSLNDFNFILGGAEVAYTEEDKGVTLYVEDDDYSYNSNTTRKIIHLKWIYSNGTNLKAITSTNANELPSEASVHWYRYKKENTMHDQYGGLEWECIERNSTDNIFTLPVTTFSADSNSESFKVIIISGEGSIIERSNVLVLSRSQSELNESESNKIKYLADCKLLFNDNSNGIYPYYNYMWDLEREESWRANINRQISCNFSTLIAENDFYSALKRIVWRLPFKLISPIAPDGGRLPKTIFTTVGDFLIYDFNLSSIYAEKNLINITDKINYIKEHLLTIGYNIKSTLDSTDTQGNIICELIFEDDTVYSCNVALTMQLAGIAGNYIVINKITDSSYTEIPAILPLVQDSNNSVSNREYILITKVFDAAGTEVVLDADSKVTILQNGDKRIFFANQTYSTNYSATGEVKFIYQLDTISQDAQLIFKQELKIVGGASIVNYHSVATVVPPERAAINIATLSQWRYCGPTYIRYNPTGTNPKFNSAEIKLYDETGAERQNNATISINFETAQPALPTLKTINREGRILVPKTIYDTNIESAENKICYLTIPFIDRGYTFHWYQPIAIYQENFTSEIISNWDGALTIDNDNNKVLAASVAAGHMNAQGFTGVIVGEIGNNNMETAAKSTGVFGFSEGIPVYSFKDNGTATIGAPGAGQIQLDGSSGIIKSGNFDGTYISSYDNGKYISELANAGTSGTLFDLTNGQLITNGGTFRGDLQAYSGFIGPWNINSTALTATKKGSNSNQNVITMGLFNDAIMMGSEIPSNEAIGSLSYLAMAVGIPERFVDEDAPELPINASETDLNIWRSEWEKAKNNTDNFKYFRTVDPQDTLVTPAYYFISTKTGGQFQLELEIPGMPHPKSIYLNNLTLSGGEQITDFKQTFMGLTGNTAKFMINLDNPSIAEQYYKKYVTKATAGWANTLPNFQIFDNGYVYSRFGKLGTYYADKLSVKELNVGTYVQTRVEGKTVSIHIEDYYEDGIQKQKAGWLNFENGLLTSFTSTPQGTLAIQHDDSI